MEYINGQSLHQWLSKLGKLSVGDAIHVTLACAYALEYAHDLDLIHRDVKPDNVLITRDGVVKLADLGMVKMSDEDMSLTQTGHAVGTPWYMPLEQARNSKDIDARSDIYALGCMFYCMLAGRPPFRGSNIVEVIQAKERGTFPPAKQFNPEVPSRLDLIISKMTAKLPQHRYQNCGEFIDELEELALVNLELEFINNPPVQNSTVDVPPEEKTPYPVKQTMEAPTDLWFLRTRNRQGKVETKRMTTAQVIGLLKSGLIKPESRISRQEHTGFRSLATVREFQHVAFAKVAKSAADRQASKYRQLYKRIEESELVREQEEENEDEVPLSQIILRVAIIGGAILGGVGLIWLIVMLIRVIS